MPLPASLEALNAILCSLLYRAPSFRTCTVILTLFCSQLPRQCKLMLIDAGSYVCFVCLTQFVTQMCVEALDSLDIDQYAD